MLPFLTMFQGSRTMGSPAPNSPGLILSQPSRASPQVWVLGPRSTQRQLFGRTEGVGSVEGLHRTGGDLHPAGKCLRGSGRNREQTEARVPPLEWVQGLGLSHPRMPLRGLPWWSGVKNRVPGPGTHVPAVVPEGSACHLEMKPGNHRY